MTMLEDRLTAALGARADLVRPEDLHASPPEAGRRSLLRRPTTYVLAAAACAAGVSAPFVLGGGPGDRASELPPATQSPSPTPEGSRSPTPNGDQVSGADWTEVYSYPGAFDLDGDGTTDEILVRTRGEEELPAGTRRVEAHLSTGGVAAVLLDYDTYDLTMVEPVELDGEPGDEVLYYRGTEGEEMGVLDLVDGALVDLEVPGDPGLTSEPDAGFRARGWFVEDLVLHSYRTVDDGFVPGASHEGRPPYDVDVWSWRLREGELEAVPLAPACWDGAERPSPC